MFFFKVDGPDQHSVKYKSKRTTCRFHSNAFNFKQDEILFLCFIHVILGSELLHNISFRLRLDVDIEGLCIELVSISNPLWYCIGPNSNSVVWMALHCLLESLK